jgi:hypothetical protein
VGIAIALAGCAAQAQPQAAECATRAIGFTSHWYGDETDEVSQYQYDDLIAEVRCGDKRLRPHIAKAIADGKVTHREMRDIDTATFALHRADDAEETRKARAALKREFAQ